MRTFKQLFLALGLTPIHAQLYPPEGINERDVAERDIYEREINDAIEEILYSRGLDSYHDALWSRMLQEDHLRQLRKRVTTPPPTSSKQKDANGDGKSTKAISTVPREAASSPAPFGDGTVLHGMYAGLGASKPDSDLNTIRTFYKCGECLRIYQDMQGCQKHKCHHGQPGVPPTCTEVKLSTTEDGNWIRCAEDGCYEPKKKSSYTMHVNQHIREREAARIKEAQKGGQVE